MGTAAWQPKWWTKETHESTWDKVKEALARDWQQTKVDLQGHGKDLNQDIDDTVKQAVGKDVIPPMGQANAPGGTPAIKTWEEAEAPVRYGFGARQQFGKEHAKWNDHLETSLKSEWESAKDASHSKWGDVRAYVRHGYEKVAH